MSSEATDQPHDRPHDRPDGEVEEPEHPVCSAKGCRALAAYAVVWNNPTLHTPDREKTWHACPDHRDHLAQHLDVRGFLRRVDPL